MEVRSIVRGNTIGINLGNAKVKNLRKIFGRKRVPVPETDE